MVLMYKDTWVCYTPAKHKTLNNCEVTELSDIKLFHINSGAAKALRSTSIAVEKTLQTLIEQHLEVFLGVRFLATEYSTGENHGGRIDTLGIDENGSPVIIEYKRSLNENVINQGLFYLNWLMDHKAEFKLLVLEKGFTRDVSSIGHYGTGNLEITVRDDEDLEKATPLILKSYEEN